MSRRDLGLELRPDSQFVSREGFREELDQIKNNFQFLKSQTFNKRQCKMGLGLLIILSIFSYILLCVFLVRMYSSQVKTNSSHICDRFSFK